MMHADTMMQTEEAKEELQRKEQIKEAMRKKQEKADDIAAKKRVREKIEADKLARKQKREEEKAMRSNPTALNPSPSAAPAAPGGIMAAATPKANHSEARLRVQTPTGNVMKTMPAETTLFEVAEAVKKENGTQVNTFVSNFPRKEFKYEDFGMTLKEAGLVPSAALIVK